MNARPTILIYCQHSLGMGHLVRSFALAGGLTEAFDVTFLNGGPLPEGMTPPEGINIINLPALGTEGPHGVLRSRDSRYTVEQAVTLRREMILDSFHKIKPSVLLIELFPFGRKKFTDELVPLLETARNQAFARPKIICSLRDILVDRGGEIQRKHDNRARNHLHKYFDAVMVHSDPAFARLEESFKPSEPLNVPVHYTGFVHSLKPTRKVPKPRKGVVVSAGGGLVGGPLFRAALEAQGELWEKDGIPMTLVTGPFLPEQDWQDLNSKAQGKEGLKIIRFTPDFFNVLTEASFSISQCGYNTTMDILRSKVPALVVPYEEGTQSEQLDRATRLEKLGILRVLRQETLTGKTLAHAVRSSANFSPEPNTLDLNGIQNSLKFIKGLVLDSTTKGGQRLKRDVVFRDQGHRLEDWLEPVYHALENRQEPLTVFFRDDDAGWCDEHLFHLLDIFSSHSIPIDLAIIPQALSAPLASRLRNQWKKNRSQLGLHQHGFSHENHESEGRKCEFGSARPQEEQLQDILKGQQRLKEFLGEIVDPIFTPPWNRCSEVTANCLKSLNFKVLSRDVTAEPINLQGLLEIPVHIDWLKRRKGIRITHGQLGQTIAEAIQNGGPTGIMLHHASMNTDHFHALDRLLTLFAIHQNINCCLMRDPSLNRTCQEKRSIPANIN